MWQRNGNAIGGGGGGGVGRNLSKQPFLSGSGKAASLKHAGSYSWISTVPNNMYAQWYTFEILENARIRGQ